MRTDLRRARSAGPLIIEQAEELGSEIVDLSPRHGLDPTLQYVLAKRPCRVVVETEPMRSAHSHSAA